jgi:predicted acetyltransferase
MSDVELRPADSTELPAFFRAAWETFGEEPSDEDRETYAPVFEPERSLACLDRGEIVGTTGIYTRGLTVPGGVRPAAAVTIVTVRPTHRRRGLLTAMMRRQLTDLHEQELEPVATLWASQAPIYGRFGYGLAARSAGFTARKEHMRLRREVPVGSGRVDLLSAERARPLEQEVYGAVAAATPGFLTRDERWWDRLLWDGAAARRGGSSRRHAVHVEEDGSATGYAAYRIREGKVLVEDVFGTTPAAHAALWRFLAGIDLFEELTRRHGPLDDPLEAMLLDPRSLRRDVQDSLWVRLVDLDRALATRTYAAPVDVVVDVTDEFCPWNAGRWRLSADASGATCTRTSDAADLALPVTEVGAAYLGGPRLSVLAAAGLVVEHTRGALAAASRAFAEEVQPWCPEVF